MRLSGCASSFSASVKPTTASLMRPAASSAIARSARTDATSGLSFATSSSSRIASECCSFPDSAMPSSVNASRSRLPVAVTIRRKHAREPSVSPCVRSSAASWRLASMSWASDASTEDRCSVACSGAPKSSCAAAASNGDGGCRVIAQRVHRKIDRLRMVAAIQQQLNEESLRLYAGRKSLYGSAQHVCGVGVEPRLGQLIRHDNHRFESGVRACSDCNKAVRPASRSPRSRWARPCWKSASESARPLAARLALWGEEDSTRPRVLDGNGRALSTAPAQYQSGFPVFLSLDLNL